MPRAPVPAEALLPDEAKGVRWKACSVSGHEGRARLYWYPLPWLAVMAQLTVTVLPACHTVPKRIAGSTSLPASPSLVCDVFRYCPPKVSPWSSGRKPLCPLATPHESKTGAVPGARQGLQQK
jgi:hypothetical protein